MELRWIEQTSAFFERVGTMNGLRIYLASVVLLIAVPIARGATVENKERAAKRASWGDAVGPWKSDRTCEPAQPPKNKTTHTFTAKPVRRTALLRARTKHLSQRT